MNVGIIGTGAIAAKHAQAYGNIGYKVVACTNRTQKTGADFVATPEEAAAHPDVGFLDVCAFPAYRLEAVGLGARYGKHVLVQKPMAVDLDTAKRMIDVAAKAGTQLGVVSRHRHDESTLFLKQALGESRLGAYCAGRCVCEVV